MPESDLIFRFQLHGDLEALVAFGNSLGYEEAGLRSAIEKLRNVFESISLGKLPEYDELDRSWLLEHRDESFFVIRMMASSYSPEIKKAAFHIMGELNSDLFIDDLRRALATDGESERTEAVRALGRMSHPEARAVLEEAARHPDPATRSAAQETLKPFDERVDQS